MISACKYSILLFLFLFPLTSALSQKVQIQMVSPPELKGRKAVLLTREKGFAATVHSLKLYSDMFNLDIENDLVPDLYQLHVSQINSSLFFFLEPGIKIQLDTLDLSKSIVSNSKSTQEWRLFENNIQHPYDARIKYYSKRETQARKSKNVDSLSHWIDMQSIEKEDLVKKTGDFILANPASYVSLYLLKINWYAFQDKGIFEKLDRSLAIHRTYAFLREKNNKKIVRMEQLKTLK